MLLLLVAGCRSPRPGELRSGRGLVLDDRSFAYDVAFLPGGQVGCALLEQGEHRLVSFQRGSGRRLWQRRLADGQDDLTQLAVSPSGRLLAAAFRELRPATSPAAALRSSSEDSLAPAGSVLLLELGGRRALRRVGVPRPVLALAFLDEETLALSTAAVYRGRGGAPPAAVPGSAGLCLLASSGRLLGCATAHSDSVTSVVAVPGGLASGSWDGTIRLWGPRLEPRGRLLVGAPVNALAAAASARVLAVATSREPPRRSRALAELEARGGNRAALHPGDRVELWDLATRRPMRRLHPHRFYVTELALSPDARLLASGSWDFSVVVQRGSGPPLRLERFSQIVTGLALSREADSLAAAAWTEQGSGAPSCVLLPLRR